MKWAYQFTRICLILILTNCGVKNDPQLFEGNAKYSDVELQYRRISEECDLFIGYCSNSQKDILSFKQHHKILVRKGNQWTKISFDMDNQGVVSNKEEKLLEEVDGRIAFHSLRGYHLFDIESEDALLKIHKTICGIPEDPSHFFGYKIVLISERNARIIQFNNPDGRYIMCPAIKQWDNAGKIALFFETQW